VENGSKCLVERELLSRSERLDKLRRVERGAHGRQCGVGLGAQQPGVRMMNLAIRLFRQPEQQRGALILPLCRRRWAATNSRTTS